MARNEWRHDGLVALAAWAAHATALVGGFVWLDHAHIEEGLAIAPLGQGLTLFSQGFAGTGFYRPLVGASLSLDAALGGGAWWFHAVSLMWHAAAAVLVARAGLTLGLSRRASTAAGLLFAVHPATSLVAGAIAFRSEAMLAVALLVLVITHLRGKPCLAAVALFCGALTKETALGLGPLFIGALEIVRPSPRNTRFRLVAAEIFALAVAFGMRLAFAPPWRAEFSLLSAGDAVGTRLASLFKSALLMAVPFDRTICDAFPVTAALSLRGLAGGVLLAALAYGAWRRRGLVLLLALALIPSLQLVPVMRWWSPHYLYVPLVFAALLSAEALSRIAPRAPRLTMAAFVALVLGFGALSLHDGRRFLTDETLWAAEVSADPACREGHFYMGEHARERKRLAEAVAHYEQALTPTDGVLSYVDVGAALQNLGVTQLARDNFSEARDAFRTALTVVANDESRRKLTHNLATAELRTGNPGEAARLLEPETARADALPESLFVRARALHELGREDEARALLRRIAAFAPRGLR